MDTQPSRVHLDPTALNTLLEQFVNKPGELEVSFVEGQLRCVAKGLTVTVASLTLDAEGLDIGLHFGQQP
ncbi:MAG: hypothetical protein HZB16_05255 [Armatimonadetes bacterium]|nr:hypothetical protein [Armatimonadota bacterium]